MKRHETFSRWLDSQLLAAGMSGKELAARVGVSEATISRVKNGRTTLTPRMKSRLSVVLNAKLGDMPALDSKCAKPSISLSTIQHAIPDHATVNYAFNQGLFLNNGVSVEEISDRDVGAHYPQGYFSSIKEQLALGKTVLAVGPASEFERNGLRPSVSVYSHKYKGYHLITRAAVDVPAFNDTPVYNRLFALKQLFDLFENADIWRDQFERFAWQSGMDYQFLQVLRGLSAAITGVGAAPRERKISCSSNKFGLDSLQSLGAQGADFVIGDPGILAEAYSYPEKYQVLLSLDKLIKAINGLTPDAPLSLLAGLKNTYRTDVGAVAVERFKAQWLEETTRLEVPVYWHVFCPDCAQSNSQYLMDSIASVLQDLQEELATPHLRMSALNEIKKYCDARTYQSVGAANAESFRLAWNACYVGL